MTNASENTPIHSEQDGALTITVYETDGVRWMDFGDGGVQSAIDHSDPGTLVSPLNQAMLAGLLFTPTPQQVLLLGTGGGAMARFFAHHEPDCHGDAIEQSKAVGRVARQFFDFPDSASHWSMHFDEAQAYIARNEKRYDLIVLDIAEDQHTPQWVRDETFLRQCRQRLTARGILVVNVIPTDTADFANTLSPIRMSFPRSTACLSVPTQHNILVFAFRETPVNHDIESRLEDLTQRWNLPFAEFLQRMRNENPVGSGVF